jgi:hypothetical protein
MRLIFQLHKIVNGPELWLAIAALVVIFGVGSVAQADTAAEIRTLLIGKPIDKVTAALGQPRSVSEVGSLVFVSYQSESCVTEPDCRTTALCEMTLTVDKASSTISDVKFSGTIFGPPEARARFLPEVDAICNDAFR